MTGGMTRPNLPAFEGSDRLRLDGRPTPAFRAELRRIPNAINAIEVVATMAAPVAVLAAVIAICHPLAIIAAIPVIGTLQLRWFILHHEAAHRLLFSNRWLNDRIGINLLGWLARVLFVPFHMGYHLAHHVDSGIPARNLKRLQRALEEDGYLPPEAAWPTYRLLWRALAAGSSQAGSPRAA